MRRALAIVAMVAFAAACRHAAQGPPARPAPPISNQVARPAPPADPGPSVTAIEPTHGDAAGGTYVKIVGSGFLAGGARAAKVYFGASEGAVMRFASDREMIVEAPAGKPDETVDVVVRFAPGGEHRLPGAFTFVVLHR